MRTTRLIAMLLALTAIVLAPAQLAVAQTPSAHLTLQSQKGDYIGGGGNFDITYTPATPGYFGEEYRRTVAGGAPSELLFTLGNSFPLPNTFALVFIGTDGLGIPLQPGTYTNAQRADFAAPGHPGLDIAFQNRGSNTVTGTFTINAITFAPNSGSAVLNYFDATFEQHSEGATPALFGHFTYNSGLTPPSLSRLPGPPSPSPASASAG